MSLPLDIIERLLSYSSSDWAFLIISFFLLVSAFVSALKLKDFLTERLGIESKNSKRFRKTEEDIAVLKEEVITFKNNRVHDREQSFQIQEDLISALNALKAANVVVLGDMINQKYHYYSEIEGIPEDEFDEFVALHDAYKGVDGNHSGDEKYEKAMKMKTLSIGEMIEKGLYKEGK